jgi:hypothetical protein
MKKPILFVLLFTIFYSLAANALEVTRHMSGSWWNSDQEGHGISLEVMDDDSAVFYWYVYNPDGSPTFLVAAGQVQGSTIFANAWHQTGMRWGIWDDTEMNQVPWGQLSLDFHDCNHATLTWSSDLSDTSIPHGQGSLEMERLTTIGQLQCADTRSAGIYRGYIEEDNRDWTEGATFVLAPDGGIVAFVEDRFAAFGTYGQSEAEQGEFWLDGLDVFPFGESKHAEQLTAHGSFAPEDRILIDQWQIWQDSQGEGELFALDAQYRHALDFSVFMGSAEAEELTTGETGWADIYPIDQGQRLHVDGYIGGAACHYEGNLTPFDMQFNVLEAELTLTGCFELDGSYTGLGYQTDSEHLGDYRSLVLAAQNGTRAIAFSFSSM